MVGLTPLPKLADLIKRARKFSFHGTIAAIDPGETTGVTTIRRDAETDAVELVDQRQIVGWPLEKGAKEFSSYLLDARPNQVIYEAYHIYSWRLDEHRFSEVPTIQIIGCLKTLCIFANIPYDKQTAQAGKGFFTDHRLKQLDMYFEGQPHARDSLRHAAQYLTFGIGTAGNTHTHAHT